MAKYEITGPDGKSYEVNAPDGASEQDVLAYAQRSFKMAAAPKPKAKGFGAQLSDAISDLPRQGGLTARHGIEGVGEVFDTFVGNPLRTLAAPVLGNAPTARTGATIADGLGLPQPRTAGERIIGDASRLVAGGAGTLGAASRAAQGLTGSAQAAARLLASNPGSQLASAGAAGLAGGYTRETGGGDGAQLLASLAAGVATPAAMGGAQRAASALSRRMQPATPERAQQINVTINNALQDSGITLEQLPAQVAQSIRNDVAAAFRTSDQVSPDAVRRLADYRLTGLTPTRAGLTQDAADITQQKNLASLGMNLKDKTANFLGQTEARNNQLLKTGLNNLGADAADDAYAGGERIIGALERRDERARDVIGKLYDRARDSGGRSAALDGYAFTQRAGNLLNEANVESFLTPDIRNKLNDFADGKVPLTVEIAEQFKTNIGRLQRSSMDGNVRYALGAVRQALDETPLLQATETASGAATLGGPRNVGQEAIKAFDRARRVNRMYMGLVEKTPALQAVRDGVEPDRFVQDFIVGTGKKADFMNVAQLKNAIKANPEAMTAVREQILGHLKAKALNGQADETGNFGGATYVKALDAIGERKLRLFFEPEEITQLKAIGRVARYEQFQPTGSKVNNSHTAGAAGGGLMRLLNMPLLSKIPAWGPLVQPAVQEISIGRQATGALDVPRNLIGPRQNIPASQRGLMLSPAAFMDLESEEERQRRLLAPGR